MTNKGEPKNLTFDGYYIDHGAMLALAVDGKVSVIYLEREELAKLLTPEQWELQRDAYIQMIEQMRAQPAASK